MISEVKIFAGSNTQNLAEKIAKNYGKKLGDNNNTTKAIARMLRFADAYSKYYIISK